MSANLIGSIRLDRDGDDPWAIRMSGCDCHLHVDWSAVTTFDVAADDVGYGPEPCVTFAGDGVHIRFYFPIEKTEPLARAIEALARRKLGAGAEPPRARSS
jgi:hypothetical protein